MPLPSFTVTGNVFDILGNTVGGEILGNGFGGGTPAQVIFTSNVPIDTFVTYGGAAFRVRPVAATVNSAGEIVRNGEPVQLLADDPGLNVEGLQWRCDIAGMKTVVFSAPTDGGTVDIAGVVPVPFMSVVGLPSLSVSGLSDATTYGKGFLTSVDDAAEGRAYLGISSSGNEWSPLANLAAFPNPGVTGVEYLAVDTGKLYRWAGSGGVGPGSGYIEVSIGEPPITAGITSQYWRGDKTWQTLDKSAVGLGNVSNNAQYYPGGTDVAITDGGTGASTASAARTNLGATSVGAAVFTAVDAAAARTAIGAGSGSGDASTNTATSVDGEAVLFSGTAGKTLKRSTLTGIIKQTAGVAAVATAGTDYYNPGGTDIAVADGGTGRSTSTTAYGLIAAGTTAAGTQQTIDPGTAGQFLKSAGASALAVFSTLTKADVSDFNTVTANTQTGSYTLVLADSGKVVEMNAASANNLTVPLNSSVAFPVGTIIELFQYGAGQTTVVATGGVTIRSSGGKLKLTGQYSGAALRKRATDEWVLTGDITT